MLGEVRTGLLQNSTAVPPELCAQALTLLAGERVRQAERPMAYAVSPELLVGVDCRLATTTGARARGIGAAISRAVIIGGHVLQGSAFATVRRSGTDRRLPWSHYLSQPGTIEAVGKADSDSVAAGFLSAGPAPVTLDLGAIGARVMDSVHASPALDRMPPFRMPRTSLRWVAVPAPAPEAQRIEFRIESRTFRTLRVTCPVVDEPAVVDLCEDLALHDWLLTTLLQLIERSRIGAVPRPRVFEQLRPAVDYLLHLWMPGARVDRSLLPLWESLERRPGFSRQWQASVDRIRDQVAASTIAIVAAAIRRDARRP